MPDGLWKISYLRDDIGADGQAVADGVLDRNDLEPLIPNVVVAVRLDVFLLGFPVIFRQSDSLQRRNLIFLRP